VGFEETMDERLAAAQEALKTGRGDDAIPLLASLLEADPEQPVGAYRALVVQLYRANRYEEGSRWGELAMGRYPRDIDLLNVLGVINRRLFNYPRALEILDQATKLAPTNLAVATNRGNVLLDMNDAPRAETLFAKLTRAEPRNAEYHRQLGRALLKQDKRPQAVGRFRQAVALKKDYVDAWLDLIGIEVEEQRFDETEALIQRALAANPDHERLLEAHAVALRRFGRFRACEAYLLELMPRFSNSAWLHYQLGGVISDYDRERGNVHLRRALELEPDKLDHAMALIESLERTRTGDEGAHIEESYQLALRTLATNHAPLSPGHSKIIFEVLVRVCAFDDFARVTDFKERGRGWAETGRHTALLKQLAHVETLDDRYELLEQHRIWGRLIEGRVAKTPIRKPAPRPKDGKIRLGIMSSDLRGHPVGYFALPLFENADRERFELYCYSFYQGDRTDSLQQLFAANSAAFRWHSDLSSRDAAQMIADDQLDMLLELGGSTHMNKLDVMAYRPAPVLASWLGYPHSAGLSAIDYLITDPYHTPRRDLLVEAPLMMPKSWIALGRMVFSDGHVITPGLPEDRNGRITFGTANNPHKYNRTMIALWAEVMRAVPRSRFTFIRPEGSTASFRRHLLAEFARHGIDEERIVFNTIRGAHMPFYNEVDISLDTLPLTGGTTTTESLWMGVPVVSLIGEAFYERLSYSILANSGLADLAGETPADYVRIATDLVASRERRLDLRRNLRDTIRSGPLGQTEQFAKDFYDLIARTVRPTA
jgi:protein O-GlcNAc transferase